MLTCSRIHPLASVVTSIFARALASRRHTSVHEIEKVVENPPEGGGPQIVYVLPANHLFSSFRRRFLVRLRSFLNLCFFIFSFRCLLTLISCITDGLVILPPIRNLFQRLSRNVEIFDTGSAMSLWLLPSGSAMSASCGNEIDTMGEEAATYVL